MKFVILFVCIALIAIANGALTCKFNFTDTKSGDGITNLDPSVEGQGVVGLPGWNIPYFTLFNNVWGVVNDFNNNKALYTQTTFTCDDPTGNKGYGWTWNRTMSTVGGQHNWWPNYPEVAYGLGPMNYGLNSNTALLPARLSTLTYLQANMNISTEVVYHNDLAGSVTYDFAYDIWWASVNPAVAQAKDNITDEIMIFFHWQENITSAVVLPNAVNDGYNVYDYTQFSQSTDRYHQFRITGTQRIPPKVNFLPFFHFVQQRYNVPDVFLCSLEIGNEVWDGSYGTTIINHLSYDFVAPPTTTTTTSTTATSASTTSSTTTATTTKSTTSTSTSTASSTASGTTTAKPTSTSASTSTTSSSASTSPSTPAPSTSSPSASPSSSPTTTSAPNDNTAASTMYPVALLFTCMLFLF